MDRTSTRIRRFLSYRPLVERLEDRLPPGDVFGALLADTWLPAERATGLVPVVLTARPGPARSLAASPRTQALPVYASLEALPPEDGETLASRAAEPRGVRTQAEPVYEETLANRRLPLSRPDDAPLANPATLSSALFALGTPSDFHSTVFVTPPSVNYQLDQAIAALIPLNEDDGRAGIQSSGVHALFNLDHPNNGAFPSNVFTVPDRTMNTNLRINMPFPDCKVYVSDCEDLAVLNELDGFNLQPRLSVPFSGPIDVDTATSETVFLISLGSTVPGQGYMPRGTVVGINQIVWDVETNALHVESDELLAQHTRFALIVTNGVRDADGDRVEASQEFRQFRETAPPAYRRELEDAIAVARRLGISERQMVTASVFTTQSATAVLEKIRDQIKAGTPEAADFLLGPKGERTVFPRDDITGIRWNQQIRDNPPGFNPVNLNLATLDIFPSAVSEVAFGKYVSPNYRVHPGEYIPPVGTRTGTPVVQGMNEVQFTLYLPSSPRPAGGWPVAIVAHGGAANMHTFPLNYASRLADRGIATIGINAVGFGFGPLGTLTINRRAGAPVTFPSGGRSFDQNGDGDIVLREGDSSVAPRAILLNTDGHRQTTVDLMQMVRVIQVGIDVHGTGDRDLDPSRIYYFGLSYSGFHGTMFLAVEPDVHAGALNVTGGPFIDLIRMRTADRSDVGQMLAERVPPLLNSPGVTQISGLPMNAPYFYEGLPLRNGVSFHVRLEDGTGRDIQSPMSNDVPGAMAIQELIDRMRWVQQAASPPAYAPHLRRSPLPGVPAKSVLYQFPKGDQTIANPWQTAMLRAGNLADRATFYRHDLAFAEDPTMPRDPHGFVNMITNPNPNVVAVARGYQDQIATFFESDGKTIIHPEPKRFFEVPIQGPLPEELNYIP